MITNTHERVLNSAPQQIAALIDRLGSRDDPLWPSDRWPRIRFDGPLDVGVKGGHGPIRYVIEEYEPGRSIRFRFTRPAGFRGTHRFEIEELAPGRNRLRHVIEMRPTAAAWLQWTFAIRWLHDALLEDALDRAEACVGQTPARPARWSAWVRFLRWAASQGRN